MNKFHLKHFDICGSIVGLVYKGSRRYKSIIGGILSMFLVAAIFIVIVVHLNDFFSRTKAKMSFEEFKYNTPPYLNVTTNFNFIMMLQFNGQNNLRQDAVAITAYARRKENSIWTSHEIPKIPCVPNEQISVKLFERLELDKGRCFDMSGIALNASNANDFYEYVEIKVSLCKNDPGCLSQDEIKDLFIKEKPMAMFYFMDSSFQVYDFNNRMSNFYNNHDCNLTYTNTKESFLLFSLNEMQIDESYFFAGKPKVYSGFMIESMRQTGQVRAETDDELLYINLQSSKFRKVTYVSYMQISELLANICAFVNLFIMFFCSLGSYFNHFFFQADLINAFYNLDDEDSDSFLETKQKIMSISQLNKKKKFEVKTSATKLPTTSVCNINNTSNNNNITTTANNKSTHLQLNRSGQNIPINTTDQSSYVLESLPKTQSEKHLKGNRKRKVLNHSNAIQIMFAPYLPCCSHSKEKDLIIKVANANRSLLFYQDLKNIYRKLLEIDLLKYLMLSENELALFNMVPKPVIKKNDDIKGIKDFASLINLSHFHFLKSPKYIKEVSNTPKYKGLLALKLQSCSKNDNSFNQKVMNLITCSVI